ncbi:hypothetical protein JCM3774_001589 [Rhodotorula dairenensis]
MRWLLLATLLPAAASAFYLPGAAPISYRDGDPVELTVNALGAYGDWGEFGLEPYDAYDDRIPFCKPKSLHSQALSLGSALNGDRLYNSDFSLRMRRNETCQTLCTTTIKPGQNSFLQTLASHYAHRWLVDGLPAAEIRGDANGELFYSAGFPVGERRVLSDSSPVKDGEARPEPPGELEFEYRLNNHFTIVVEYHPRPKEGVNRVVGVLVWPQSVDSLSGGSAAQPNCGSRQPFILPSDATASRPVAYTYDVVWRESSVPWATRWDNYLHVTSARIHALSLVNSLVVCVFLCLIVAAILLRVLNRDITKYNALSRGFAYDLDLDPDDQVQDDSGWKLLHGEVFRAPKYRMWLCITVGTGAQMAAMCGVTLFFALLGFLSPSNRGALSTVMVVCWTLFGFVAGYVSSRLYVTMRGDAIRKNIIYTALVFPSVLFAFLHLLNFFLIGLGSAGAVPFGTFAAIALMWFGIHVPLTIIGGWIGVKRGALAIPTRVNAIPRQVPPVEWWLRPIPSALLAGLLPFGAGFIEIYFVMQSLFGAKAYYAFGFLALTSCLVAMTTALTTVLFAYLHLCAEDWRWQWRSFVNGASSALYIFAYGLVYWASRLHLSGVSNKVLFLGYLLFISGMSAIVTGTIGFVATWAFVRVIYSRVRVD